MIDPVTVELIRGALQYAAEEMGLAVRNASYSPNIKERLDHSCALFDAEGRLAAQAEHIPVHLGSLPWGLRHTLSYLQERGMALSEGDMIVVNDPYIAGTHLPDITVVRPIFYQGSLVGYTANKAHHDDVGGSVPGSLNARAPELYAEGLILPPVFLMRRGEIVDDVVQVILANSRTPHVREGDLKAQIAGNMVGERRVLETLAEHGPATYADALPMIMDLSEARLRRAVANLPDGNYYAEEFLESDGFNEKPVRLAVTVTIDGEHLSIDYTGTDPQLPGALNAVLGVALSGVYYTVAALVDPGVPVNEGLLRAVEIHVPEGTLLNPRRPAPVAGGNTETSMRNADLLLRALAPALPDRAPATSGGSMTNTIFGGRTAAGAWGFYETIACGMGARPGLDGLDGIHCHMTNTLNTPIEAMERSFPVLMTRYEFRPDTGGAGRYRGGCGVSRAWRLLAETCTLTLLTERSTLAARGLDGGGDGGRAAHALWREGQRQSLPAKCTVTLQAGDEVEINTPGGGGLGDPRERDQAVVLRDVSNGLVNPENARLLYGVDTTTL
jgi:N-methylhydantoinase B